MLFQITAPEYDKLFLNKLIFGLGIKKFLLATERKLDVVSSDVFLIWNTPDKRQKKKKKKKKKKKCIQ